MTGRLRLALRIHAIYFIGYAAFFEFLPAPLLKLAGLTAPADLLGGIATSVAAGGLFSCGILFWISARRDRVPRVALVTALVQTTYNLYHDVSGTLRFHPSTPIQIGIVVVDTVLILALFVVYLTTWLSLRKLPD
jgi:hypothetical protein